MDHCRAFRAAFGWPTLCLCALLVVPPLGYGDEPVTRVAVFRGAGVGRSVDDLKRVLRGLEGVYYRSITAEQIRDGQLKEFDVLIHPGGSASRQAKALQENGRSQVREFVQAGGGYLGICAGAYLATADYDWSLHVLDAKVVDRKHWARGTGAVHVGLSQAGQSFFGTPQHRLEIHYGQGPLLAPANQPNLPDYQVLARYSSEIAEKGAPRGVMIGTDAIAASTYGAGRVVCFSPHPEKSVGLESLVEAAVCYAGGTRGLTDPTVPTSLPAQWVSARERTPDISQRGMPNPNYCAPCAVANLLLAWQSSESFSAESTSEAARRLAIQLGGPEYMQTKQRNGTNRYRLVNGMHRMVEQQDKHLYGTYLGVRDYALKELDEPMREALQASVGVPTLEHLKAEVVGGKGVVILFGSYKPNPKNSNRMERVGGHYVAVVGYGVNAAGEADSQSILLHDSNDGTTGDKVVVARKPETKIELWDGDVLLSSGRRLVELQHAPITQDGRIAYLETVFSFELR